MFIDSEHDTRFVMERGEHLLLGYLLPGWLENTLFLLRFTIPVKRVEGQTYRIRLARRKLQRVFKKTTPPDFLS